MQSTGSRQCKLPRVSANDWYRAVQQSVSWASNLSHDVTLIGHSAGGLLAFGIAAERTDIVKHVILLSPALNINWENSTEAIFFANLGVSGSFLDFLSGQTVKEDENYQSSFAGRELLKLETSLSNAPLASTHQESSISYGRQIELLKKTEVVWFGTEEDDTLDREKNKIVLQEMRANGDDVKRFVFRKDLHVKHEDLPLLTDTEKTLILDAIQSILRKSNSPVRPLRAPSSLLRESFS